MPSKKKLQVFIFAIIICLMLFLGCTERQRKEIKHLKSDLIGLKRVVTLYDNNGKIIKQWKGRFKIEIQGNFLSFIDDRGKEIKISGTILVEEQ